MTRVSYRVANPGQGLRDTYVRGTRNCMPVCNSVCLCSCVCVRARPCVRLRVRVSSRCWGKRHGAFSPPRRLQDGSLSYAFTQHPPALIKKLRWARVLSPLISEVSHYTRLHEHSLAVVLGVESAARVRESATQRMHSNRGASREGSVRMR